ncbi:unnamed protein product [Arctogadus glacialis]
MCLGRPPLHPPLFSRAACRRSEVDLDTALQIAKSMRSINCLALVFCLMADVCYRPAGSVIGSSGAHRSIDRNVFTDISESR